MMKRFRPHSTRALNLLRSFVVLIIVGFCASAPAAAGTGFAYGDVFVADHGQIVEFTSDGTVVRTLTDSRFIQAFDLAFDKAGSHLYVTDAIAHDVKVIDRSGSVVGTFGADFLSQPRGIAVHPTTGHVYVADTGGSDVEVFDTTGNHLRTIGPVNVPLNLAFSADGTRLFVSESEYFTGVQVFDLRDKDRYLGTLGETSTQVVLTSALGVAQDGTLYVGDSAFGGAQDSIKVFNADGSFVGTLASGLSAPTDLTFDANGNVWVTNTNDFVGDQILAYGPAGNLIRSFGGDQLGQPTGLAFCLRQQLNRPPLATPAPTMCSEGR
jgi:DNA-binding beta-propeller fold protein YncE